MTRDQNPSGLDLQKYLQRLPENVPARVRGRVRALTGLVLRASIPNVTIGELDSIETRDPHHNHTAKLPAQVVGFHEEEVFLMPLGEVTGIGPGSAVDAMGVPLQIQCGPELRGRILNGLGQPIDGRGPLEGPGWKNWSVDRPPPHPLKRARITKPLETGVRVIDGLTTLGLGQRVGLFAGSGVGKSQLLGQIARNANTDVAVICLLGERGREVRGFVEDALGEGLARSVVVCATSDTPGLIRQKAAYVATSIAEYFRDQNLNVLLLMDSLTRFARAQREIGLAIGEPPVRRGYPPSVFRNLPRLIERTGQGEQGSITAIYTVLVDGDNMDDPIADELRGLLDGHIVLDRTLAARAHWPAVDVLASLSRLRNQLLDPEHQRAADRFQRTMAVYEQHRMLINLGAYQHGSSPEVDEAIEYISAMDTFVQQAQDQYTSHRETRDRLVNLWSEHY